MREIEALKLAHANQSVPRQHEDVEAVSSVSQVCIRDRVVQILRDCIDGIGEVVRVASVAMRDCSLLKSHYELVGIQDALLGQLQN